MAHSEITIDAEGNLIGVVDHDRTRELGLLLAYEVGAATNNVAAVRLAVEEAQTLDPTGFPLTAAYAFEHLAEHVLRPLVEQLNTGSRDYLDALTAIRDALRDQEVNRGRRQD